MLPSHAGPPSNPSGIAHFVVNSSDVLEQAMQVKVEEEGTGRVIWFKERTLTDTEIVDVLIDATSNSLRWSIHRPKRGWYIRLRAPSFPPGTFVPLIPTPTTPDDVEGGGLSFGCRTLVPKEKRSDAPHSYPPTPQSSLPSSPAPSGPIPLPAAVADPSRGPRAPSTAFSPPPGSSTAPQSPPAGPPPPTQITHFTLALTPPIDRGPRLPSFLSRALNPLKSTIAPHRSFALSPPHPSPPVLVYTDRTPIFSTQTTGLLEVDLSQVGKNGYGVDLSFWIAASLAFLEFSMDRDGYLAAANG